MDELDGGVGFVDLLASWAGTLKVGHCQVGIVDFEARRELFCGEGRSEGEGAAEGGRRVDGFG